MAQEKLKKALAEGKAEIDALLEGRATDGLIKAIGVEIASAKSEEQRQTFALIREMILNKEIKTLTVKLNFIY